VCARIIDKPAGFLHKQDFEFRSGRTLYVSLKKEEWIRLERFVHVPEGLRYEDAKRIRDETMLAPERVDDRERWLYKDATPSMRLAKQRFREDGLLLPFGHPRIGFTVPNP
jgi:hypothetical protein